MIEAQGFLVDKQTRCIHYHSKLDIIALQCYDCKKYYACYRCHDSLENHPFEPYPLS
ncbi:CHY zinc finger [Streptococcus pneumoniae PNI0076]|nr:CHY zinc finger [Streptococcus pneumoniae PNI0076]